MTALKEQDFAEAAASLNCEVAAVKAVCQVEAPRGGFNPDGSPVTLFEGHKFYKFTDGLHSIDAPDLCYPKWTRAHYGRTWQAEQDRLQRAIALNREAALKSASWGRFQIMGFNHIMCGFDDVESFVAAMAQSERAQLQAFIAYVRAAGLAPALRRRDWAGFAAGYNGPGYEANDYDGKLAMAYFGFAA